MSAGWLADHQWIISPCLLWAIWCAMPIRAGSDGGGWPRGKAEPRPSLPGSPPITSQQVQCLVDSWEHMTHMKSLIDLRHSIRLLGSPESPPLPSLSLFVTFNLIFFHHLLFIFLPRFVSSKMKVIPKISTRWNRGKGVSFFFLLYCFSAQRLLCMRVRGSWCDLTLPPHGDYSANPTRVPADETLGRDSPSASLPGRSLSSALLFSPPLISPQSHFQSLCLIISHWGDNWLMQWYRYQCLINSELSLNTIIYIMRWVQRPGWCDVAFGHDVMNVFCLTILHVMFWVLRMIKFAT